MNYREYDEILEDLDTEIFQHLDGILGGEMAGRITNVCSIAARVILAENLDDWSQEILNTRERRTASGEKE